MPRVDLGPSGPEPGERGDGAGALPLSYTADLAPHAEVGEAICRLRAGRRPS